MASWLLGCFGSGLGARFKWALFGVWPPYRMVSPLVTMCSSGLEITCGWFVVGSIGSRPARVVLCFF